MLMINLLSEVYTKILEFEKEKTNITDKKSNKYKQLERINSKMKDAFKLMQEASTAKVCDELSNFRKNNKRRFGLNDNKCNVRKRKIR